MENGFSDLNSAPHPFKASPRPPRLLLEWETGYRVFLRNLADTLLFRPLPETKFPSPHAPFWPDVFVSRALPWRHWLSSALLHIMVIAAFWAQARLWASRPQSVVRAIFRQSDVIYFSPNEYLPSLNTGIRSSPRSQKGHPEYFRQAIISAPPKSDNSSQTLITPPKIKLHRNLPLPNIVVWDQPVPLLPWMATAQPRPTMTLPTRVIAPPLQVNAATDRKGLPPEPGVIEPPPQVEMTSSRQPASAPPPAVVVPPPSVLPGVRRLGELNIGSSQVVRPVAQLPRSAQSASPSIAQTSVSSGEVVPPPPAVRMGAGRGSFGGPAEGVVPPPPSIPGNGRLSSSPGQLISLSLRPAAEPPPAEVAGNRRGTFAAVPEGKFGAAGTPDMAADRFAQHDAEGTAGFGARAELPRGIFVGPSANRAPSAEIAGNGTNAKLGMSSKSSWTRPSTPSAFTADNHATRLPPTSHLATPAASAPTPLERQVFGARKSYSMVLNMPNLNSELGSWVIRFAELKQSTTQPSEELIPPEATHKVDPGYPLELMHENIQGTVALYAVIHIDGTVGEVRVLSSPDNRLAFYARTALSRWQFRPAQKNGYPVALEAVVVIPFRCSRGF